VLQPDRELRQQLALLLLDLPQQTAPQLALRFSTEATVALLRAQQSAELAAERLVQPGLEEMPVSEQPELWERVRLLTERLVKVPERPESLCEPPVRLVSITAEAVQVEIPTRQPIVPPELVHQELFS
jgi:hypothetical protein